MNTFFACILAALLAVATPHAAIATAAAGRPPNIILILADDVSARELSTYGGPITMPQLDRLAAEGVRFDHGWSTPLCGPSRAMLMTGEYPQHTGYYENQVFPKTPIEQDSRHLPLLRMMREAGYATGWFGKLHDGGAADMKFSGADEWLIQRYWDGHDGPAQNSWQPDRLGMYGVTWYWHPGFIHNGKGLPTTPDDFGPDLELEYLLAFAQANKDRPFIAFWPTFLPHKAYDEKRPGKDKWVYTDVPELDADGKATGRRRPGSLDSTMQYLDLLLGKLRAGLGRLDLAENTIIIFLGDNGTADVDKGRYTRDDALRVPFVAGGGPVRKTGPSDVLVDFTDIWPTCAELAGYRGPMKSDGHSFAPYLLGKPFIPRETIRMAFNNARWIRDHDWLLDGQGRFFSVRGAKTREEYKDVSTSKDPDVIAARQRFQAYLQDFPLPDENDPLTQEAWQRFRKMKGGAPVKVFRPDGLN